MKIIKTKNVIDIIWGFRPATCFCLKHFKFWKEGADFPKACAKCVLELNFPTFCGRYGFHVTRGDGKCISCGKEVKE